MPQIFVFAAVAIVGWIGYKAFLREAGRVRARVRRAEDEARNRRGEPSCGILKPVSTMFKRTDRLCVLPVVPRGL